MIKILKVGIVAAMAITITTACQSTSDAPEVSPDGMQLQVNKRSTLAYKKEGVSFAQYNKIHILPSQVAFKKDWKRDYNKSQSSISMRVNDKDVLRIKSEVAKLFDEVFTEEFSKNNAALSVNEISADTLVIKPAIINLDVNAPDVQSANNVKTYVQDAGQATLFLEMYDGVSGEILARIIDSETVGDRAYTRWANRVSNRADAKRTIRKWAKALRKKYDQAHANSEK